MERRRTTWQLNAANGSYGQGTADNSELTSGILMNRVSGTNVLTEDIEAVQAKVNTARVQAGSQYAALESSLSLQLI